MNPIRNPFSRDEHPDLTAAILGVVNESHTRAQLEKKSTTELRALRKTHASKGAKADSRSAETLAHIHGILRSRGAGAALDEDLQTPERAAEMVARKKKAARHSADAMKRNPEGAGTAAIVNSEIDLHIKDKRERDSKKTYGVGGKVVREAVTAAQQKVFARERERMLNALNNPKQKLSPTEREAVLARGARNAAAETRKGAVSPTGEKSPIHSAAKAHHEYARRESKKLDAILKKYGIGQKKTVKEGMSDSIEMKEGFAPQIITPDNIMFYQVVYGSIAALWLAGIVADLPRTVGNMWNNAKRKYKDDQETSKAMQTDFAKLSDEILKNIPSEWSSQRKTHLKKLLNAAKTLSSATGEDKKIEYGKLVREIQRYMSVHGRGGKVLKRKVQEDSQLDERLVGGADFLQASKNLLTGKGFKTNREVSGARVNANMAAMQRRKARAAKTAKKTK